MSKILVGEPDPNPGVNTTELPVAGYLRLAALAGGGDCVKSGSEGPAPRAPRGILKEKKQGVALRVARRERDVQCVGGREGRGR